MPIYNADFTPSGGSVINIMIFDYQGSFKTVPSYREADNIQLDGTYQVFTGRKSTPETVRVIVEAAAETALIAAENLKGTLNVGSGDAAYTNVRLLYLKRIKGLGIATQALSGSRLEVTFTYYECETAWIKEPA